eukprot:14123001-Alexandrium_andersonii.AAC.1
MPGSPEFCVEAWLGRGWQTAEQGNAHNQHAAWLPRTWMWQIETRHRQHANMTQRHTHTLCKFM